MTMMLPHDDALISTFSACSTSRGGWNVVSAPT
jgi:hypothetical protein